MGIVAFVTNRKSSNLVALASSAIGLEYNLKVLVMHRDPHRRTERALIGRRTLAAEEAVMDTGAGDGLRELARQTLSRKLTPESVRDNSRYAIKGYLDVLPYTADMQIDAPTFMAVANVASKLYDFVFIDAQNCPPRDVGEIVKASDSVIAVLNQDMYMVEDYMKANLPALNESIVVLEDYHPDSKYTAGKIGRYLKLSRTPLVAPHSVQFIDAVNDGEAVNFMRRSKNAWRGHPNTVFAKSCSKLAVELIRLFGLNAEALRKV